MKMDVNVHFRSGGEQESLWPSYAFSSEGLKHSWDVRVSELEGSPLPRMSLEAALLCPVRSREEMEQRPVAGRNLGYAAT